MAARVTACHGVRVRDQPGVFHPAAASSAHPAPFTTMFRAECRAVARYRRGRACRCAALSVHQGGSVCVCLLCVAGTHHAWPDRIEQRGAASQPGADGEERPVSKWLGLRAVEAPRKLIDACSSWGGSDTPSAQAQARGQGVCMSTEQRAEQQCSSAQPSQCNVHTTAKQNEHSEKISSAL